MGRVCLRQTSWGMGCPREPIAPHVWQAAGRQGDGILARPAGQVGDEPHQTSRWRAEGIVARLSLSTLGPLLGLQGVGNPGFLERLRRRRGERGLASPLSRVGLAPLPHAFHRRRAAAVVAVGGCAPPPALTGRLAGLLAWRTGTGVLTPNVAMVGIKEDCAVLTLALADVPCHWPASPQVNARPGAVWKEEHGAEKAGHSKRQKREEM